MNAALCRSAFWVLLALGALLLWRTDFEHRVSTNVLDLIPDADRSPEVALVRQLASQRQGRVVLVTLELPKADAAQRLAAERFAVAHLAANPAFEELTAVDDPESLKRLGAFVFENRFRLLWPQWLAAKRGEFESSKIDESFPRWLARAAVADLDAFLAAPEALALQDVLPRDPLLLMRGALAAAQSGSRFAGDERVARVWALQRGNPFDESAQSEIHDSIAGLEASFTREYSGAVFRWTGVAKFARESRNRIESEMKVINTLSLGAVFAVAALALRRVVGIINLAPPVVFGLIGAWAGTMVGFERVQVLVFVVGALLSGVAIDYSFYLYIENERRAEETYGQKVRRLLSPLLGSALTTILGFLVLLGSDLPLVRQVSIFVTCGLGASLVGALLWFGQLRRHSLPVRPFVAFQFSRTPRRKRLAGFALAGTLVAGICGLLRVSWRDDVRSLEVASAVLKDNDRIVRAQMGESGDVRVYLSTGGTLAEALERAHLLADRLGQSASSSSDEALSLAALVPRPASWQTASALESDLADFPAFLKEGLAEAGYDTATFTPFFLEFSARPALASQSLDDALDAFRRELRGPMSMLVGFENGFAWVASLASAEGTAVSSPGSFEVSQLATLNSVFSRYRQSALRLGTIGLGILVVSVVMMYGPRRGAGVFVVSLGATVCAFGAFGWLGTQLNLFHLLGAFLGVCLSHNYSIFMTESRLRAQPFPPAVRLSACTTAASFGALAWSKIQVVSALGSTVACIVVLAWLIAEAVFLMTPQEGVSRIP